MPLKRELILERLLVLASDVEGIVSAWRHKDEVSDMSRPAIVIMDADEVARDSDPPGRPTRAPRVVDMTPEIYILVGGKSGTVGTDVNVLLGRLQKKILEDATLQELTLNDNGVRYEGCATGLGRGRSMEAEMGVSFTFTYLLKASDL